MHSQSSCLFLLQAHDAGALYIFVTSWRGLEANVPIRARSRLHEGLLNPRSTRMTDEIFQLMMTSGLWGSSKASQKSEKFGFGPGPDGAHLLYRLANARLQRQLTGS